MITFSTVLPNGDIPRITVGVPDNLLCQKVQIPLRLTKCKLAMSILDQLSHPEAPEVWRFSEAEYAMLISTGMVINFEGV